MAVVEPVTDLLDRVWYSILPGTREEFARFMGCTVKALQHADVEYVSDLAVERFGIYALGGGYRFPGTGLEERTFRFKPPSCHLWRWAGLPGRARIDRATECVVISGHGKTPAEAALSAMLGLWELTYLRGMGN